MEEQENNRFSLIDWDTASDPELNQFVYSGDYAYVMFDISSFQPVSHNHPTRGDLIDRAVFRFFFNQEGDMSGVIEEAFLQITTADGKVHTFEWDEIEPDQLYWIGRAFIKIASHHGVTKESIEKEGKEEHE